MSIKIIHTADNHLGMKFSGRNYPPEVRKILIEDRFEALKRTVEIANKKEAHFIIIAGDLFDSINIGQKSLKKTADILHKFTGESVLILPGNHDFYEANADGIWEKFRAFINENKITLLTDFQELHWQIGEQTLCFFPAPCQSKHSANHVIDWVIEAKKNPQNINLGIAHGNVTGLGIDQDKYFNMPPNDLKAANLDAWFLGHIHKAFPTNAASQNPDFLFAGTPSPDGFDEKSLGFCWLVEIDEKKKIKLEQIQTGAYQFQEIQENISSLSDLENIENCLNELNSKKILLKLRLNGRLAQAEKQTLNEKINQFRNDFFYFEYENQIALNINQAYIEENFIRNSLPYNLLSELAAEDDDLALQLAFELISNAK